MQDAIRARHLRYRVFAVLWAICLLFDLSNRGTIDTPAQAAATLGALWVLLRPRSTAALGLTCAAYVVNIATHPGADFLFVHWCFDALVCTVVVVAWVDRAIRAGRPWVDGAALLGALSPAARALVWIAIGAAGFAKLNEAFLDPALSCGSALYLAQARAPGFRAVLPDATWARRFAIGLTLAAELGVPLAVLSRRARPVAIGLATIFFALLSINPINHLYEFACPMLALLFLFTADPIPLAVAARIGRHGVAWSRAGRVAAAAWVIWIVASGAGEPAWLARAASCRVLLGVGLPALLAAYLWHLPPHTERHTARALLGGGAAVAWLAPLALLANEASPYLGFPHQPSFTMASDLRTLHGASNHLLIHPPSLPGNATVEIVSSNDRFLRAIAREDARTGWYTLRWVLSRHPHVRARLRVDGGPVETIERAGDDARFAEPWLAPLAQIPWFARAIVQTEQPPGRRCGHWHHPSVGGP